MTKKEMRPTIAALQYEALRAAWTAAREAYDFSDQDEADWAEGMDELWQKMTTEDKEAVRLKGCEALDKLEKARSALVPDLRSRNKGS